MARTSPAVHPGNGIKAKPLLGYMDYCVGDDMQFIRDGLLSPAKLKSFSRAFQQAILLPGLLFFIVVSHPVVAAAEQFRPWILVDTQVRKIAVMRGLKPVKTFSGASIGRGGANRDRSNGDQTTPIGEFSIAWISDSEKYHKFLGISWPGLEQARRALDENRISTKNFTRIKKALDKGILPPQDTELGGNLGIHGLGKGDRAIHDSFNWTNGCIALTNEQLDELSKFVQLGTTVIIR